MGASLANVGPGVAQVVGEHLQGVDDALRVGETVLEAALAAEAATDELIGIDPEQPKEAYIEAAKRAAGVATRALGMVDSLVYSGLVDRADLLPLEEEPAVDASDAQPDPEAGDEADAAAAGEPEGSSQGSSEGQPDPDAGSSDAEGSDMDETDPEEEAKRERQESMVEAIFGQGNSELIRTLTQDEFVKLGKTVEILYREETDVPARARPKQADRASQFAEYIRGDDPAEIGDVYGISRHGVTQNLDKAIEILHREHSQEYLTDLLKDSINHWRSKA